MGHGGQCLGGLGVRYRGFESLTTGRAQAHPYPLSRRFCALWLAQGSDTVELCLSTVLVLPNFARRSHHSDVTDGIKQLFLSTHRSYKINTLQRYIKNLVIPNLWSYFFLTGAKLCLVGYDSLCLHFIIYCLFKPLVIDIIIFI